MTLVFGICMSFAYIQACDQSASRQENRTGERERNRMLVSAYAASPQGAFTILISAVDSPAEA